MSCKIKCGQKKKQNSIRFTIEITFIIMWQESLCNRLWWLDSWEDFAAMISTLFFLIIRVTTSLILSLTSKNKNTFVFNLLIFWIQNQIILSCHFSEPRERSTALSTQAAMLVVLLFFQVDKRSHLYLVLYRFLNISCSLKKRSPAEHAEDREGFDARDRGQVFLWQLGHLHLHGKVPISFTSCSLDI